jgi:hypothetical protein
VPERDEESKKNLKYYIEIRGYMRMNKNPIRMDSHWFKEGAWIVTRPNVADNSKFSSFAIFIDILLFDSRRVGIIAGLWRLSKKWR